METNVSCRKIGEWVTKPHGFAKERFAEIHDEILFDRAVTAQLYRPKRVQLTAYPTPALRAVDPKGSICEGKPYKYLPSKKEILAYASEVIEKAGSDVPFDIVTEDGLYCFPNGRARIGGMQTEPTGEFSSVVVYRHRPSKDICCEHYEKAGSEVFA